jgi:hypothetical protein
MRARYLIRDMANGDIDAWKRAEAKLSQPDIQPVNRQDLLDAMATLYDPRRPELVERVPVDHRRYAITVHATEDWGDPPAVDTNYIYTCRTDAVIEAHREMWRQYCLGAPKSHIGAYVVSNDADSTESGDPSVEMLFALPAPRRTLTATDRP